MKQTESKIEPGIEPSFEQTSFNACLRHNTRESKHLPVLALASLLLSSCEMSVGGFDGVNEAIYFPTLIMTAAPVQTLGQTYVTLDTDAESVKLYINNQQPIVVDPDSGPIALPVAEIGHCTVCGVADNDDIAQTISFLVLEHPFTSYNLRRAVAAGVEPLTLEDTLRVSSPGTSVRLWTNCHLDSYTHQSISAMLQNINVPTENYKFGPLPDIYRFIGPHWGLLGTAGPLSAGQYRLDIFGNGDPTVISQVVAEYIPEAP